MAENITKLTFESYSYSGPQLIYYLDLVNQTMKLKTMMYYGDDSPNYWLKENLNQEQCETIQATLQDLAIPKWKKEYLNPTVMDGEQWSLTVVFDDDFQKNSSGSNAYPLHFDEIRAIFTALDEKKNTVFRKYRF